jgi:hypothetical protein
MANRCRGDSMSDHRDMRVSAPGIVLGLVWVALLCGTRIEGKTERHWQTGTWLDANQTIRTTRTGLVPGTTVGGCAVVADRDNALGFEICAIEADQHIYLGRKRLNIFGGDTAPVTANTAARFAVENKTLYALAEDGKEYKFDLLADIPTAAAR